MTKHSLGRDMFADANTVVVTYDKKLIFSEDMRLGKYTYDVRVLDRVPENL